MAACDAASLTSFELPGSCEIQRAFQSACSACSTSAWKSWVAAGAALGGGLPAAGVSGTLVLFALATGGETLAAVFVTVLPEIRYGSGGVMPLSRATRSP